MKKIVYVISFAALFILNVAALQAQVRGSQLRVDAGVGMNTLFYEPSIGERTNGLGGRLGLTYSYYFKERLGIGIGAYGNLFNSKYSLTGHDFYDGSYTTDEANYGYQYSKSSYLRLSEQQRMISVSIPVSLKYRFEIGWKWDMRLNAGVAVEIPVARRYYSDGDLSLSAYYKELNIRFHDMPNHGLFTDSYREDGAFKSANIGVSPFVEIGFSHRVTEQVRFYLGLYASYGVMNYLRNNPNPVFYDGDDVNSRPQNVFASDVTEEMHPFCAGLSIGFIHLFQKDDRGDLVMTAQFMEPIIPYEYKVEEEELEKAEEEVVAIKVDTTCEDVVAINYKWLADSTAKADGLDIAINGYTKPSTKPTTKPSTVPSTKPSSSTVRHSQTPSSYRNTTPKRSEKPKNTNSTVTKPNTQNTNQTTPALEVTEKWEETKVDPVKLQKAEQVLLAEEKEVRPVNKIGQTTVHKKKIYMNCGKGPKAALSFTEPGDEELTESKLRALKQLATYLKSHPQETVTFSVEGEESVSRFVQQKNQSYFEKIKKQLIQYGVKENQVIMGDEGK
ncbi:MAG: hypothetical protein J6Y78_12885 [Paludibacteraceae bacterium]|nr:hypothetical protein [Paludibacteraceae bacterium]